MVPIHTIGMTPTPLDVGNHTLFAILYNFGQLDISVQFSSGAVCINPQEV